MINFLKKISYHSFIIQTIRFFHLQPILRRWYYQLVRPPDGIFKIEIGEINAKFHITSPEELRSVESNKEGEGKVSEILISCLSPGDIAYDIGAHLGFYTIFFAKAVGKNGKVIAFEPEKESYKHLKDNLKLNNLKNVQTFPKAIGEKPGKAKLYLGKTIGNFSLVKTYEKTIDYQEAEIVHGDQFVKKKKLPIPKLIKIDVEGYEYSVLEGLEETLSHPECKIICCEVHPNLLPLPISEEKILKLINSFGFQKFEFQKRINGYHIIAQK